MICECIKLLRKKDYIHPDILHANTYFIYPIVWDNGRGKVCKTGLLLNYCPVCGKKIELAV